MAKSSRTPSPVKQKESDLNADARDHQQKVSETDQSSSSSSKPLNATDYPGLPGVTTKGDVADHANQANKSRSRSKSPSPGHTYSDAAHQGAENQQQDETLQAQHGQKEHSSPQAAAEGTKYNAKATSRSSSPLDKANNNHNRVDTAADDIRSLSIDQKSSKYLDRADHQSQSHPAKPNQVPQFSQPFSFTPHSTSASTSTHTNANNSNDHKNTTDSSKSNPFSFVPSNTINTTAAHGNSTKQSSTVATQDEEEEDGGAEDGEAPESVDVHFTPVIKLQQQTNVTGEDEEECLYKVRAKMYRFDQDQNEWKERGTGEIKLLKHSATGKVRLLMRRDKTLKVCANHLLTQDMELKPNISSDKSWVYFVNADMTDEGVKSERLAVRFGTSDVAQEFKRHFEEGQEMNKGNKK